MESTYKLNKIYYGIAETKFGKEPRIVMDITDDLLDYDIVWRLFKDLFHNDSYYSDLTDYKFYAGREGELPKLSFTTGPAYNEKSKVVQTTRFYKQGPISDFATIEERKAGTISQGRLRELYSVYLKSFMESESKIEKIQKEIDVLQSQLLMLQKRKEELESNSKRLLI